MPTPVFDLVCPRCRARCRGQTFENGIHGSYRNPYVRFGVSRITCRHCGYAKDLPPAAAGDYQLWFRLDVFGHSLWARNADHLRWLRTCLLDRRRRNEPGGGYALPQWLLRAPARTLALRKIDLALSPTGAS